MQRARRLASVAVVASLGVTGLSACQQAPTVAAYLGPLGRISEKQVQEVWDNAHASLEQQAKNAAADQAKQTGASPAAPQPVVMPISRADVVTTLIGAKVLDQVAQSRHLTADPDKVINEDATAKHMPPSSEYMQLYAHWDSLVTQLKSAAASAPGDASDADYQAVYDVLVANKAADPAGGFAAWKSQLADQNKTLIKVSAGARDQLKPVADAALIKVNPRYQPAVLPVLNFQADANSPLVPLLSLPLGRNNATAPVSDAS